MRPQRITGRCLCGGVAYRAGGPIRDVVNCHCSQCRRTHGHVAAYANALKSNFELTAESTLKCYRASDFASRGFCGVCGASLFWRGDEADHIGIAAGTIDAPSGLETIRNIFTESKGDYYDITDGLEQFPRGQG